MKSKLLLFTVFTLFFTSSLSGQGRDYWQQRAEYDMEIEVDVENYRFSGTQELTYHNNSPDTLRKVYYHLYFNAFQPGSMMDVRSRTISDPDSRVRDRILYLSDEEIGWQRVNSLTQDGSELEYEVDGTILEVTLAEPILPDQQTVFEMEFQSQVPLQVRRTGRTNAEGIEFSNSQWYPKLAEYDELGWHPNPYVAREFYGVWGDFEVSITIDSSYVVAGTGVLQNPQEIGHGYQEEGSEVNRPDNGQLTWHWVAEDVHDFMWAADPDYNHTTAQVPGGPLLRFFYQTDPVVENETNISQQQLLQNWEQLPELTVKAFQFMSENFGQYPWPQFSVIQGGDGGMEYPMATLITGGRSLPSLTGVTVHEFVHMWYYGVLANNESRFPWFDEGFTSYASALIMNHLFNNQEDPHGGSYSSYYSIVRSGEQEALDTHADHYATNNAYGAAAYSTGAVFLNQLRYVIGNETFDRGMKRFFETWKFKHPGGYDFLRVMEKESDMVLDWYYEYFIESTRTIDYGITSVIGDEEETRIVLERHGLMPMPIDLLVEYSDGSTELFYLPLRIMRGEKPNDSGHEWTILDDWPWVNPTYTVSVDRAASDISRIIIDPSGRMADVERSNNVIEMGTLQED